MTTDAPAGLSGRAPIHRWTGELARPLDEEAFRRAQLDQDWARARAMVLLVACAAAVFLAVDALLAGWQLVLTTILPIRLAGLMPAFVVLLRHRGRPDPRVLPSDLAWVLVAFFASMVAITWLLPSNIPVSVAWTCAMLVLAVLTLPVRFTGYAGAGALFVGGMAGAIAFRTDLLPADVMSWSILLVGCYGACLILARHLNGLRRQEFRALHNAFPPDVVRRLRAEEEVADEHDDVSILFVDLVDFTRQADHMPVREVVRSLDAWFDALDVLAARHGVEKIKTIGDCYMAATNVTVAHPDHCAALADFALSVRRLAGEQRFGELALRVRMGIHSGPVYAAILGGTRQLYDLWGDTVNTASRMESTGVPDAIQVSDAVAERLADRYVLEPRGSRSIKGKGEMGTHLLTGPQAEPAASRQGRPASASRRLAHGGGDQPA